jgi:type IV pilus assembly protein PilX
VSNNLFLARRFPASRAQAGVALVVGLILLVVLTVLALSTLRTATLGLLMAGNDQYRENAFQLAESGITARLRQATLDATQLDAAADCPADADPPLAMDAAVPVADLGGQYATSLCRRGYSSALVPGSSVGKVGYLNFEIAALGTTDQRGANARLVQGFYQVVPARP